MLLEIDKRQDAGGRLRKPKPYLNFRKPVGNMPRGFKNTLTDEYIATLGYKRTVEFTPELIDKIANTLRQGCSIETAFRANRISPIRFDVFERRAKLGKEPFCSILEELESIVAEWEIRLLSKMTDSATSVRESAQCMWQLERLVPERYGPSAPKNNRKEIIHTENKQVNIKMKLDSGLPAIALEKAKKQLLEALPIVDVIPEPIKEEIPN